ncbi:hypothetical protein [Streptomyces catenulae]|uniref:Uncharacterized protein n=1 Tax=Streptomyces catenulae TaxID=66875 RepID=A0ABV2Z1N4_9ACTN|nr:hypothetical protein [Streptomyces catenulae]
MSRDGQLLTTFTSGKGQSKGSFRLGGAEYTVRAHAFGGTYELLTEAGTCVATAERVGRRNWSLRASGQEFVFRRASFAGRNQELLGADGEPVGSIACAAGFKLGATADLPGLADEAQVFVTAVMLLRWQRQRNTVAASTAASG